MHTKNQLLLSEKLNVEGFTFKVMKTAEEIFTKSKAGKKDG